MPNHQTHTRRRARSRFAALATLALLLPAGAPAHAQDADAPPPRSQADAPPPETPTGPLAGLRTRLDPNATASPTPIGSLEDASDFDLEVEFTPYGAGIASVRLTHEYVTVERREHYELQSMMRGNETLSLDPDQLDPALDRIAELGDTPADDPSRQAAQQRAATALADLGLSGYAADLAGVTDPEAASALIARIESWLGRIIVPFTLYAIEINGQTVDLSNIGGAGGKPRGVWTQTAPGAFSATVENADGRPVARVSRRFELDPASYALALTQTVENLTDQPLTVRLIQTGPIDPHKPRSTYGGDKRRFRYGYLLSPRDQAGDPTVLADHQLVHHHQYLGKKSATTRAGLSAYETRKRLWPTERADRQGHRLVWTALTDRYFAVAVHPIVPAGAEGSPDAKVFSDIAAIDRLVLNHASTDVQETTAVLDLVGHARTVPPGETLTSTLGIYAGPMSKPVMQDEPVPAAINLDHIIIYNFGSCMSWCTFGWLTHLLLGVLRFNHLITADWAVSIILLVVIVRTCLHPITRWSQIRMQRFGVQMQSLGPKMQKLKEKYKDDPKQMQAETARLWREEGVSPAGFLGCLPMFLQSPVWIALYATLFFAAELRHEPAFYGVFQSISGGSWAFLADLSAPDSALPLGPLAFTPPLIGQFVGEIRSVNLLPILMGFVFFAHQKYLTPPTTATLTPEQQSQQRLIRIMTVVMFPLIMYAAPSGLTIYFVTNSTIAIFENRWIRAHMNKHGMLDPDKIRAEKSRKGPGFFARLQEMAAQQQQMKQAQQKGYSSPGPRSKKTVNRNYKKKK
ncbi:MAG: YidC/Oxa1 family insertase periplasmic-domain containing protein [Phycisphaerales bacterium JB040]